MKSGARGGLWSSRFLGCRAAARCVYSGHPLGRMASVVALLSVLLACHCRAATYTEWIAGYPSLTGNATLESADPDSDGIPNLLEYALDGCDPTTITPWTNLPKLYLQTRNTDGSYNTPSTGRVVQPSGGTVHLVLRYKKRAGTTGLRYVAQTNNKTLQDWGWGDSAVTEWTDGDGYTWARTISDFSLWHAAFMRLRVETQ